ncbi:hypothetical protein VHEMI00274 [[Torrubiella] hemipterigena]|uniref:N-acetyltransferase domain-containing protein n=1 Tax=[Torrubiella] hemipterigena TaxID=1531966 RepID=A0A0A1T422_9HYPO|nr:hypothetical protein VHEMI00274 [[Torrubiella] hemipterigena]
MQPTLQTTRLTLVPLTEEHLPLIIRLNGSPEVMQFIDTKPHTADQATAEFRERMSQGQPIPGLGVWAGSMDGKLVGWWSVAPIKAEDGTFSRQTGLLGYRLLPEIWRQGLAKEGAKEVIRHAFEDVGLLEITAETMAINAGSRATMTSCGLKYVRTFYLEFDDPIPGTELGEVEYRITRQEWQG